MSVVVCPNPAFWAPGHLVVPDRPGKPYIFKFEARFKRLDEEETKALDARLNKAHEQHQARIQAILKGESAPEFAPAITDRELLDLVMVDWGDEFKDAEKKPVMYTPAVRIETCQATPGLEVAMSRAYLEARNPSQDLKEAEKNSEAPPATT